MKLRIEDSTFCPRGSLEGKNNFKTFFRIQKDGSIKQRVFLNVPDLSLREEIICKHYLSFLVRNFIQTPVGVNLVSRDDPWDFGVNLSNGTSFNVEITSIADNEWSQEKTKREETLEKVVRKEKIELIKLKKIISWFGVEHHKKVIIDADKEKVGPNELIDNPFFGEKGKIYISDTKNEEGSLTKLITAAVKKKSDKKHSGKEKTVLVIDNRTSKFELSDYQNAREELGEIFETNPFPEIYFYTGYYSNNDGSNSEYSFAPIKLPNSKWKRLKKSITSKQIVQTEAGIAYDDFQT